MPSIPYCKAGHGGTPATYAGGLACALQARGLIRHACAMGGTTRRLKAARVAIPIHPAPHHTNSVQTDTQPTCWLFSSCSLTSSGWSAALAARACRRRLADLSGCRAPGCGAGRGNAAQPTCPTPLKAVAEFIAGESASVAGRSPSTPGKVTNDNPTGLGPCRNERIAVLFHPHTVRPSKKGRCTQ